MRFAILVLLSGCSVHKGNGEAETRSVDLTDVVDIENQSSIDVNVVAGEAAESAELTCDSNLLQFIETVVADDALVVRLTDLVTIDPRSTCEVTATVALLEVLRGSGSGSTSGTGDLIGFVDGSASGSGPVTLDGIVGDGVELRASGSGDLTAAGTAGRLDLSSSGSGDVDAEDLVAIDAVVTNSGSGSTSVTATRDIEVHVSGSGDVEVYGDPQGAVVIDETGSGQVTLH